MASYSAVIDVRVQGQDELRALTDGVGRLTQLVKNIKPVPTLFDKRGTDEVKRLKTELTDLVKSYADGNTRAAKFSTSLAGLSQQLTTFRAVANNARVGTDEFNNSLKAAEITSGRLLRAELERLNTLQNLYTRSATGGLSAAEQGPTKLVRDLLAVQNTLPGNIASLRAYQAELNRVFELVEAGSTDYLALQQAIANVNRQIDVATGAGPVQGPTLPPRAATITGMPAPSGPTSSINPMARRAAAAENLMLGAGFPLLFGGGGGQVAGGLLGSFVGTGFGGQILGSAIGQQLEDAQRRITEIGNALSALNMEDLKNSAILVNNELATQVRLLQEAGRADEARAAIADQVMVQTGLMPETVSDITNNVNLLGNTWNELVGAVSGTLAIIGTPFVSALTLIGQLIAKTFQGVNLIASGIGVILKKVIDVVLNLLWLKPILKFIEEHTKAISEAEDSRVASLKVITDKQLKELQNNQNLLKLESQRTLGRTTAEKQINAEIDKQLATEKVRQEYADKAKQLKQEYASITTTEGQQELKLALQINSALEKQAIKQVEIKNSLTEQALQLETNSEQYKQATDAIQRQSEALDRNNQVTQSRFSAEAALNGLYGAQLDRQYELATTAQQRFDIAIKQFYQQVAAAAIEYKQTKANNELIVQKAQLEYNLVEIKYQQIQAEKLLAIAYAETHGATDAQIQKIAAAYDKALGIQTEIVQASRDQVSAASEIAKNQDIAAAAVYKTKVIQAESNLAQKLTSDEIGLSKQKADQLAGALSSGVYQASAMQTALNGVAASAANAAANIAKATGQSYVVTSRTEQTTSTGSTMSATYKYADGTTGSSFIQAFYAKGGYVSKPTVAMVGEGGQGEYVVPESKAANFAMNYMLGARGAGAIDGNASTPTINITTGPVMQQNGQNYVTIQDMEAGLQAVADTILNNSRSYSSRRFTGVT